MQNFKSVSFISGLALMAAALPMAASPALARSQAEVSAGVSKECTPRLTTFTIPQGQTATNISVEHLSFGVNCGTNLVLYDGGFGISSGRCPQQDGDIYWMDRTGLNESHSTPGLSALTIPAGTYCLSFHGGKGGGVRLSYTLIP